MTELLEIVLAAFLLIDLWLAAASRLRHCINLVAYQGILIGVFPLVLWNWNDGFPHTGLLIAAAVNICVKGWLLPHLLTNAMYKAQVRRELEPFIGYSLSLLIVLAAAGASFLFCAKYRIGAESGSVLSAPAAFTTMLTGLFIITARRKAITQAIGFLVFENGITVFGLGMTVDCGPVVELGILLDVFVLIFVMGIAVFQISREFAHIDADRLTLLRDETEPEDGEGTH